MEEFLITPWEVRGKIDYEKLMKDFGIKPISKTILRRLSKYGKIHTFLRRGIVFGHRDFDWILRKFEKGEKFYLYTGRGPSGKTHLGHLIPWIFTKYLQDTFKAKLYFQVTDDEKFLLGKVKMDEVRSYVYDNLLDFYALGFNQKLTKILIDTVDIPELYKIAVKVAKSINFSVVRAVFGFENTTNIGMIFFPAIQAAPCFIETEISGKATPCLIPASPDQDPYWRGIARAVAEKLGYYKPAQIYTKILPGLKEGEKMSSSKPSTCIFTTDSAEDVKRKVADIFTGGQPTIREQREKGGNPKICRVFQYLLFFEDSDKDIKKVRRECESGKLTCGECKKMLAQKLIKFLERHKENREKAKVVVDEIFREKGLRIPKSD